MLLTITSTNAPATHLRYPLTKTPPGCNRFHFRLGRRMSFIPKRAVSAALRLCFWMSNQVALVRNRRGPAGEGGTLDQYVNDRPYVASSFLSVAIARVLGSALGGRSKGRPELTDVRMPLEAVISVLPCRGGEQFLRRLFEPLGYEVIAKGHQLDEKFPEWGASSYYTVTLRGNVRSGFTHAYLCADSGARQ